MDRPSQSRPRDPLASIMQTGHPGMTTDPRRGTKQTSGRRNARPAAYLADHGLPGTALRPRQHQPAFPIRSLNHQTYTCPDLPALECGRTSSEHPACPRQHRFPAGLAASFSRPNGNKRTKSLIQNVFTCSRWLGWLLSSPPPPKAYNNKCWYRCRNMGNLLHCWERVKGYGCVENSLVVPQ